MVVESKLWINGVPRDSSTGKTFNVINAASQSVVTRAAAASSEDVVAAIEVADKVQPAWEALHWRVRQEIFLKAAELIITPKYTKKIQDAVGDELSALSAWSGIEGRGTRKHFLFAVEQSAKLQGETFPSEVFPGGTVLVERRAFGTVFAISTYNAPVFVAARAIVLPLICGNAVVLKSSELTPRGAEILVEVLYEAGLPKGVMNLVHIATEDAPRIVSEIIAHKAIKHINFTGSDRIGRILATEAAKYLKPCVLELGGKSPVIVLDDADLDKAANIIFLGATANAGQVCISTERVLVQRGAADVLIDKLLQIAKNTKAGNDANSDIAPLVSSTAASRVLDMVKDAKERGGKIIAGDLKTNGAVLQPHIVLGLEPGWQMWDRETFGPVFGIKVFDTIKEAIELANKTDYSLSAAVWTRDAEKGLSISRQIRSGQVIMNGPTIHYEPSIGVRGLGGATGYGDFEIDSFVQKRVIFMVPSAKL